MDAFIDKAKHINTIEEATDFLWEMLPSPSSATLHALEFAIKSHEGQTRKSGEPYITHPILVASITAKISNDETMVQSALLHDVVEDTACTIEELISMFGQDVGDMVEGLTKIVEIRDEELIASGSNERLINSALTFRKMLIASIKDVRVLVVKLCDRLHNMLTLDAMSDEKKKRISEETLLVYAPIAHRLGISKLKNYLEDLSFKYIYPTDYNEINTYLTSNSQNLQFKLNSFIQNVTAIMEQEGFCEEDFTIEGRVKHYYSIYMKMHRKGVSIEEVLDLLAIRIVVKNSIDCYKVLGLMHLDFTPLISRFKDYIAVPKENGYKTLHTTLFNKDGIVEAQIRTTQMHQLAEYGVAAHWKYKGGDKKEKVNLSWLESLHYGKDSIEEFYELAKSDLFSEDIIVFSPKGDYYTLPKHAIALDFAYAIHSEVGENAKEALVNKQKTSLLQVLKNGDIVKIIKDDKPHLYCSWVDTVKTSKAREGIRNACKTRLKECNTQTAYNILGTLLSKNSISMKVLTDDLGLNDTIYKLTITLDYYKEAIHQLATHIGKKEVRFWELLKKGYKKPKIKHIEHFQFFTNRHLDGVEFDFCCHPKIGDEIVAFSLENKAIIHHKLCTKAYEKILNGENMIFVAWQGSKFSRFRLTLSLQNRKGILAELFTQLAELNLNILSIELGIRDSQKAEFCQIEVESKAFDKLSLADRISKKFKLIEIISLDDAYNK